MYNINECDVTYSVAYQHELTVQHLTNIFNPKKEFPNESKIILFQKSRYLIIVTMRCRFFLSDKEPSVVEKLTEKVENFYCVKTKLLVHMIYENSREDFQKGISLKAKYITVFNEIDSKSVFIEFLEEIEAARKKH